MIVKISFDQNSKYDENYLLIKDIGVHVVGKYKFVHIYFFVFSDDRHAHAKKQKTDEEEEEDLNDANFDEVNF